MRKFPYMPHLFITAFLTASLCGSLPSWADTDGGSSSKQTVSAEHNSGQPAEARQESPQPASADAPSAGESGAVRTVKLEVPVNSSVTVKVLPNGDTLVTNDSSGTGVELISDYHKNWPPPEEPSFLNYPWPYIPENFAGRPYLGVIDLQSTSHGYPDQVRISDAQLARDSRLVLKRSAVLSSRVVNKLNFEDQQQMLNTPELTLSSRFAPTFFNTKNILLLHQPVNDVYSATLVDLANLRGRRLYAPHTRDSAAAHTYLIKQALLPENQAQQNVISDDKSRHYHCLGASDINAKHAKKVYDNPSQAEAAALTPCPKCFEIRPFASSRRSKSKAGAASESKPAAETSPVSPLQSETAVQPAEETAAADYSAVKSAQSKTASPGTAASVSQQPDSSGTDWEDSFLHRPYQSLKNRPKKAKNDSKISASLSAKAADRPVQDRHRPFVTRAPLSQKHIKDKCFDDTYRHLLRSNGISDIQCAAFLISDSDYCAFPYYSNGPIYVTRGLYGELETPGELSAALSRELAKLLLGYVSDSRIRYYDDPSRPWLMTYRTRRIIEDSQLLYDWYSTMDMLRLCGSGPYWSYSPIPMLGYTSLSDHAYFELSDEQEQKVDKVAAVMCFAAGFDPSEYASYINKINKLQQRCETSNGDINMWLLSSGTDQKNSLALQKVLRSLKSLNRSMQEIAPNDPAMARALRTQAALYVSEPQTVQRFIKAYQAAVPAE